MRFFDIVQAAAGRLGKVFFLWTGEGHDITTDELDGEDLSGWLVDESNAELFESLWTKPGASIPDDLDDTSCFARWSQDEDGRIEIRFE